MNPVALAAAAWAAFGGTGALGNGEADLSFGTDGVAYLEPPSASSRGTLLAVESEGHIVTCDTVIGPSSHNEFGLFRLDRDGARDTTFGTGGATTIAFDANDAPYEALCRAVAIDVERRVVAVGVGFPPGYPSALSEVLATRLNADGSLDETFGDTGRLHFGSTLLSTARAERPLRSTRPAAS